MIDRRLAQSRLIVHDSDTIADIAIFSWLRSWANQGIVLTDDPHLKAWFDGIAARSAVQRGVKVLADRPKPLTDDKSRDILFGKNAVPAPLSAETLGIRARIMGLSGRSAAW